MSLTEIIKSIRNNDKELTSISCRSTLISEKGAIALADALKNNNTITTIDLGDSPIGDGGAKALAEALKGNDIVTNLRLSSTNISDEGVKALAEMLRENNTITSLRISCKGIGNEGVEALAAALMVNHTITDIDFSYSNIDDARAKVLADMLRENHTITRINLQHSKLQAEGIKALAEALKENHTITFLLLGYNSIGPEGAKILAEVLKVNQTITILDLSFSRIYIEGTEALTEAIKENHAITHICLDGNGMWDEGASALAAALKENRTINQISFSYNFISYEWYKFLAEVLQDNYTITKILADINCSKAVTTRNNLFLASAAKNLSNGKILNSDEIYTLRAHLAKAVECGYCPEGYHGYMKSLVQNIPSAAKLHPHSFAAQMLGADKEEENKIGQFLDYKDLALLNDAIFGRFDDLKKKVMIESKEKDIIKYDSVSIQSALKIMDMKRPPAVEGQLGSVASEAEDHTLRIETHALTPDNISIDTYAAPDAPRVSDASDAPGVPDKPLSIISRYLPKAQLATQVIGLGADSALLWLQPTSSHFYSVIHDIYPLITSYYWGGSGYLMARSAVEAISALEQGDWHRAISHMSTPLVYIAASNAFAGAPWVYTLSNMLIPSAYIPASAALIGSSLGVSMGVGLFAYSAYKAGGKIVALYDGWTDGELESLEAYKNVCDWLQQVVGFDSCSQRYADAILEYKLDISYKLNSKGVVKFTDKAYEGALKDFEEAAELNPQDSTILGNRVSTLKILGKYRESIDVMKRVLGTIRPITKSAEGAAESLLSIPENVEVLKKEQLQHDKDLEEQYKNTGGYDGFFQKIDDYLAPHLIGKNYPTRSIEPSSDIINIPGKPPYDICSIPYPTEVKLYVCLITYGNGMIQAMDALHPDLESGFVKEIAHWGAEGA